MSQRLGHSDVAFTIRVYHHVMPNVELKAMLPFDEVLQEKNKDRLLFLSAPLRFRDQTVTKTHFSPIKSPLRVSKAVPLLAFLELMEGFEPSTCALRVRCSTPEPHQHAYIF